MGRFHPCASLTSVLQPYLSPFPAVFTYFPKLRALVALLWFLKHLQWPQQLCPHFFPQLFLICILLGVVRKICLPSFPQSIFHPNCSPNLILQTFQTKFPSPIKSLLIFMSPCNSQVFSVKIVPHTGFSLSLVLCINISGFDSCLGFRFRWHPEVKSF